MEDKLIPYIPPKELINKYWNILNKKCSNQEALEIINMSPYLNKRISFFNYGFYVLSFAYHRLVDFGEIDQTIMFNLQTAGYSAMQDESGDLGFKDNLLYRYSGHNWQKI